MELKIVYYDFLTEDIKKLRIDVFLKEQGFSTEFDEIDEHACYLVVYDKDVACATLRFFYDEKLKSYVLGRICVKKEYRGNHIGSMLVLKAEDYLKIHGAHQIMLHAQVAKKEFYNKCGYIEFGEIDYDENVAHIWMKKTF